MCKCERCGTLKLLLYMQRAEYPEVRKAGEIIRGSQERCLLLVAEVQQRYTSVLW